MITIKRKDIPQDIFDQIAKELDAEELDKGLYVKAKMLSRGKSADTESIYIELRAEQLLDGAKYTAENGHHTRFKGYTILEKGGDYTAVKEDQLDAEKLIDDRLNEGYNIRDRGYQFDESIDVEKLMLRKFGWWDFWSVMVIIGSIFGALSNPSPLTIGLGFLGVGLGCMALNKSRSAFILLTVLSVNPLVWIINGIYIKNRYHHPALIGKKTH